MSSPFFSEINFTANDLVVNIDQTRPSHLIIRHLDNNNISVLIYGTPDGAIIIEPENDSSALLTEERKSAKKIFVTTPTPA